MASRGKKKQTEAQDMKNTQMNRQTDGISGTTWRMRQWCA